MAPKLAIVAGGGGLPSLLREACDAVGREVLFLAIQGEVKNNLTPEPDKWIMLAQWGANLDYLRQNKVKQLVFAGTVKRPNLKDLRPDKRGAAFLTRLGLSWFGDDSILSTVLKEIENEGFEIISPNSLLENIVSRSGSYGKISPSAGDLKDIQRGINVIRKIGENDIGQALILEEGIVIAIEAAEGTNEMLLRCKPFLSNGNHSVLVKAPKPGQELRIDMPTIGPETVELAYKIGLSGIAVQAGGVLVIDEEKVIRLADKLGLYVYGI
tara:strand:- start:1334 stop:2140 length:807 start_codon:yes stop_codon:yes gene_type:complete